MGGLTLFEQLFKDYGIRLAPLTVNGQNWLSDGEYIFCLIDQNAFHHTDLQELAFFSARLIQQGDERVAGILPTKNGKYFTKLNDRSYVLLVLPKVQNPEPPESTSLAQFHKKGRGALAAANQVRSLPHWRDFWTKRIDDLSVHWNEVEQKTERSEYEELFLRVFPYFSGRAENAIQYWTDLMIDGKITDKLTICHHRFNEYSWGAQSLFVKTPDQWVIDHPARDVAEWIRSAMNESRHPTSDIYDFIDTYQENNELSAGGLGLVFTRILFPILFIENSEFVFDYSGDSEQALMRLKHILNRTNEEERFLASFGKRYLKPLPRVDWLANKLKSSI